MLTGDFTVEVKVAGKFAPGKANITGRTSFNGAGLLLMQNEQTYVRLERAVLVRGERQQHYANLETRINGRTVRFGTPNDFQIDSAKDCELRLERRDDQIRGAVCQGDDPWHDLPPRTVQLPRKLWVGVAAVNASDQPFAPLFAKLSLEKLPESEMSVPETKTPAMEPEASAAETDASASETDALRVEGNGPSWAKGAV